jgi:hypothetical protein
VKKGISNPVFTKSGLAVNKAVYIKKCLPVLGKFIKKYHQKDLASAHYAKDILGNLQKGVEPAKCSQTSVDRKFLSYVGENSVPE